jgi:DNA-binding MarR family transcriptional regulator
VSDRSGPDQDGPDQDGPGHGGPDDAATGVDADRWFIDLVRVETRLYNAVENRLKAELGLTAGRFQMMRLIADVPNCRVLDLVRETAITVGAVSKAVDRIEEAGWCRRDSNPHDRRSSYLTLTPDGQRVLAAATPIFPAEVTELLAAESDDALAQSGATLARLRRALETVPRTAQ